MYRLPPLHRNELAVHLPCTGYDLLMLTMLGAQVGDSRQSCESRRSLLLQSPSLLMWALCNQVDRWNTLEDLETALADLAEDASWQATLVANLSCEPASFAVDTQYCSQLAHHSTAAMHLIDRQLEKHDKRSIGQLLGLCCRSSAWLSAGHSEATSPTDLSRAFLPSGLVDALEKLNLEESSTDPVETANRVLDVLAFPCDGPLPSPWRNQARQIADGVAARWMFDWSTVLAACPSVLRLNQRLEALEHRFQDTLEQEKLAAMKQLAYGASHEINNPLANISTRAQALMHDEHDPERRRKLATITSQAFRAHEMIANMMLFAHPPSIQLGECDLVEVIREATGELADRFQTQQTILQLELPASPWPLWADANHLAIAIKAICQNSLEALAAGGQVKVRLERTGANGPGDHWSEIQIQDDGPGIPPEIRRHIFDPFFSGREAGRGLGFGLSKAWRIARMHDGDLRVESGDLDGTRLVMRLPNLRPVS